MSTYLCSHVKAEQVVKNKYLRQQRCGPTEDCSEIHGESMQQILKKIATTSTTLDKNHKETT